MKIVVTGSSGRIGRGIYGALAAHHEVVGIDRMPFSSTHYVSDFVNPQILRQALTGADVIIHTAALHAPHVGLVADEQFYKVNVTGTQLVVQMAKELGVPRFIFTSTTAVYGGVVQQRTCTWIDESTVPVPNTVYQSSKLEAERFLQTQAAPNFAVRVIRMSRCFPEVPELMVLYRIHRGIDVRDAATAHAAAISNSGPAYQVYIASGSTPFLPADCEQLSRSAREVLADRCPELVAEYERRSWPLPSIIDRVYASQSAENALGWRTKWGPAEVFRQYDDGDIEVLPRVYQSGPW